MALAPIDWILIGLYLALSFGIALWYSRSAGRSTSDFFLGGRNLPWYIAGISMVATTFAADTPLAVSELVATKGISGNWLWWNMMIGGMLTAFFFARLWRRANILTEVEFIDIRYDGMAAKILRGFKSVYLGLFMNVLVMGWVNLALVSLLEVFFKLDFGTSLWVTGGAMLFVAIYSSLGGLLGVAITDVVQFVIAMTGSIVLAVVVLNSEEVGGIEGIQAKISPESGLWNLVPNIGEGGDIAGTLAITIGAFFAFIGFQWWASWYPGAEPGGGGYIAQRMMSAKSEKDSIFATILFQVAHYSIRPWPWILVGMATLVLYSPQFMPSIDADMLATIQSMAKDGKTLEDITSALGSAAQAPEIQKAITFQINPKLGYVFAMQQFLPAGLRGLLLVAFLAAYMSTISTQLNWGASYLLNDLYRPFLQPVHTFANAVFAEKHYIGISRAFTILLMGISLGATSLMTSISGVWSFMMECGAGLGMVLILRWFWWRINAWSEISATIAPFLVYGVLQLFFADSDLSKFPNSYFITIAFTTVVWLGVTFLTQPEPASKLQGFYKQVRPGGFWGNIPSQVGNPSSGVKYGWLFLAWAGAIVMTYSFLFAQGKILFGDWSQGGIFLGTAAIGLIAMLVGTRKSGITG